MIAIYQIGRDRYFTGQVAEIASDGGAPEGWTRSVPPALVAGQYAIWNGGWKVTTQAPTPPPVVLPDLTMRQFRLGLLSAGLLAGVETAIGALPEPDQSAARIEFEYASIVVRTDPWVSALAGMMGLTDVEIDTLWAWAATL